MQLLYCDESNLEERTGDFLLYGGICIDADRAHEYSLAMDNLRTRLRVPREYCLKFNPGPNDFSHQQFKELKRETIELAHEFGCRMFVYVILHDITRSADEARRNGINTVCYHFNSLLERIGDSGLVLIDQFNDAGNQIGAHLREKFSVGVKGLPHTPELRLQRIVGFHYSAVGQSHVASLIDVALGSLRFAINAHTRENAAHSETAGILLRSLEPLMYRGPGQVSVPEIGFTFRPKAVRSAAFRARYNDLKQFLARNGINTAQVIEAQ
jgi:hypothetical protein